MDFFNGKKTYITVGLAAVAYALFLAGVISHEQLTTVLTGLGIPALGFLRSAIAKPVTLAGPPASALPHGLRAQPEHVVRQK